MRLLLATALAVIELFTAIISKARGYPKVVYPFIKAPTFAEFKSRLQQEFGCSHEALKESLRNPLGVDGPIHYFERVVNGQTIRIAAPILNDDEIVLPSIIRSTCKNLKIDPASFGLVLG